MQRSALGVGVLLGAACWAAAQTPDGREVLQQAQTASRAVKAVRYEAKGQADGWLAQRVPAMEGAVTLVAVPGDPTPKLRIEAQVVPPGRSEPVTLQLTCDGTFVAVAEHGQKVFFRRALPIGDSLLNSAAAILVREFGSEKAFEREVQATSLEYVGREAVGDVECDVVRAVLAGDEGEVRWHFGRADHLPRRVQRSVRNGQGVASITTTITKLAVNPEVGATAFQLERPAGFTGLTPNELLEVGGEAPAWTLPSSAGGSVSLQELRGKVVLLDFWATWCGPCAMAMPIVQKLHDKYKGQPVAVYGVNCLERNPKSDPAGFMKGRGFTYPTLLKADRVAKAYQISAVPSFYLIAPDGRILMAHAGVSQNMQSQLESVIDRALGKLSRGAITSDNLTPAQPEPGTDAASGR